MFALLSIMSVLVWAFGALGYVTISDIENQAVLEGLGHTMFWPFFLWSA